MAGGIGGFSLLELFIMGGITMWPLLFFSIAAVVIVLERTIYFLYNSRRMDDLKETVEAFIKEGKIDEAKEYLENLPRRRIGARILLVLIKQHKLPEHQLERAVEAEALRCISSFENGFNFLTALGSVSPLTGFLGTVTGMIGAFKSIAEAADVNAQIVAAGIYEALITTVYGLCIAILAMTAHSILTHIVDRFSLEVESVCSDLIIAITGPGQAENEN